MRCIKCGSRKVSLVKINEGYSFTKGIVGQAVLGPVGAVAGINGKTSQAYHCSECGQDEITVMPDVIERFINEAIQKNDVRSLKDYKKQYPGIEWEETTPVISQREISIAEKEIEKKRLDNTTDNERTVKKEISVSALANMIREYINEMNAPVEKEDLCAKYDEIGRAKVYSAISDLKSKGKIKEVAEDVYVIVRDYEEMQCLAEAEKQQQQKEEDAVQQIVPELIKKASAFDKKITKDASDVFYYMDTSGTVHYEDSLLEEYRRGSRERRERNRFIIENGQDVKEFIIESDYIVFLMKDATVRIWFSDSWKEENPEWKNYQRTIEGWEEIESIHHSDGTFIGLRKDGTLVATGVNNDGHCNVDGWDNVKKIQFSGDYCYILRKDGTMTINGIREEGFEMSEADNWTNVIDFEAFSNLNLIALHEDGTVSACGRAKAHEVKNWANVVKIYADAWCVSAITSEGRAYSTQIERAEVNNWRNIVELIVAPFFTIGLKADGTVVIFEAIDKLKNSICDWKNVVSIVSPGRMFRSTMALILGVQEDGTVICSEPDAEDAVKKIKLFNNYNTIDEEVEQADKEAVSRLAEQASVRKELRIIHEQLDDEKKALDSLEMEHKGILASLNRDRIEAHVPAEKEIAEINDRIRDLRNRYSTLGFFKKKEKKEIDTAIAEAEEALKKAEREREAQKAELIRSLDEKISILKKDYEEQAESLSEKIASLQEKETELKSHKYLSERASQIIEEWAVEDKERQVILDLILEEMKKSGKRLMGVKEIQGLPGINARRLTIYEVSTYVYDLVSDGKLRREMNGERILGFSSV